MIIKVPHALSFSAMTLFDTCPRQFEAIRVTKEVVNEGNEATEYGSLVHKTIEDYIVSDTPFAAEHLMYKADVDKIKSLCKEGYSIFAEMQLGLAVSAPDFNGSNLKTVKMSFKPCGFFDADVALRGVADVIIFNHTDPNEATAAIVVDWKTGKVKVTDQLDLTAWMLRETYPKLDLVKTHFVFLVHKNITSGQSTRADQVRQTAKYETWMRRIWNNMEDETYVCKSSGLCKGWCPVKHCKHWSPKKPK